MSSRAFAERGDSMIEWMICRDSFDDARGQGSGGRRVVDRKRLLDDQAVARAVSSIVARSETQPDIGVLERTYVDSGVLPQLQNRNAQILFGRRGTGKSHVFRVLGSAIDRDSASAHFYVDLRLLGSAGQLTDPGQPLSSRCVLAFKDLLNKIHSRLLDMATDPMRESVGDDIEAVDRLSTAINEAAVAVSARQITTESTTSTRDRLTGGIKLNVKSIGAELSAESATDGASKRAQSFEETIRQTVVFASVAHRLDEALDALGIDNFYLLIDEWASLPRDIQPYMAEFLKRVVLPSSRIVLKVAALEYRSVFSIPVGNNNVVGFELGGDIAANMDLDDYYVHARTPSRVEDSFEELLYRHLGAALPDGYLERTFAIRRSIELRSALFTERATFVELVRAGEGVIRDFLGIFAKAYSRATREGRRKIDISSVEQAASDWYLSDKATSLSKAQEAVLQRIIRDVIGQRNARAFLVERDVANHPMIQSLFDFRVLHLWTRGYSDKERPGVRYDIYTLDYGTYVDLKRTKSEPQLELVESDAPAKDVVVPFDDKRSIRRIVLDPGILEVDEKMLSSS
jgi:hypothetical protein